MNKFDELFNIKGCVCAIVGFVAIIVGGLINPYNHFLIGLLLIFVAVLLYFIIVLWAANRNWLDIRAMFTAVWLVTLGLASLRLTNYQEEWLFKTWILLAISYLLFQLGAALGINNGAKIYEKKEKILSKIKLKRVSFDTRENRLFAICVVITLIGLTCFVTNIIIKGFVPAFSDDIYAYVNFYTKFYIFAVAATSITGLCYYCIHTQQISIIKKCVLWLCIFYLLILFPVLVVSRGAFIVAAIPFAVTVFYLNKRKLFVFILCILIMGGVYLFTSNLRGYTDEQLGNLFEPSDIVIGGNETEETETPGEEEEGGESHITFSLSPKAAFLYGYLTVSHDNFNEAIKYTEGYTWGARQMAAFNVILRIPIINDIIENGEFYMVRPHLNTVNMMGLFYYDFHEWGIVLCAFFWALLFGLAQGYYEKSRSIYSLLIHGFSMNAVMLSFFSTWIDSFQLWMFCGVVLIVSIASSVTLRAPKQNCQQVESE